MHEFISRKDKVRDSAAILFSSATIAAINTFANLELSSDKWFAVEAVSLLTAAVSASKLFSYLTSKER